MQKKSGQVALGGIATGMCIALMFATGMIPFSYYALPALAGLVLIAVREENGLSTALIVFAAVSLLSVFVVPIKEAALLFIAFFGYYPILQETFAKIRPKALSWVVRLVIFNAAVVAAYWVIVNVFGITEILEEFGDFGKYSVLVLLAFALRWWGFGIGLAGVLVLMATAKPIVGKGYLYPLIPWDGKALRSLLLRRPANKNNT